MRWLARIGILGMVVAAPMVSSAEPAGAKFTLSLTKEYTASSWTDEMGYGRRALGKLGFGIKNILLGWTELFTESRQAVNAGENLFYGVVKGIENAVADELGGVVQLATFPITLLDTPLPEGGTHILSF